MNTFDEIMLGEKPSVIIVNTAKENYDKVYLFLYELARGFGREHFTISTTATGYELISYEK